MVGRVPFRRRRARGLTRSRTTLSGLGLEEKRMMVAEVRVALVEVECR